MLANCGELYENFLLSTPFSEEWIFSGMEYFTLRAEVYTFDPLLAFNHD